MHGLRRVLGQRTVCQVCMPFTPRSVVQRHAGLMLKLIICRPPWLQQPSLPGGGHSVRHDIHIAGSPACFYGSRCQNHIAPCMSTISDCRPDLTLTILLPHRCEPSITRELLCLPATLWHSRRRMWDVDDALQHHTAWNTQYGVCRGHVVCWARCGTESSPFAFSFPRTGACQMLMLVQSWCCCRGVRRAWQRGGHLQWGGHAPHIAMWSRGYHDSAVLGRQRLHLQHRDCGHDGDR